MKTQKRFNEHLISPKYVSFDETVNFKSESLGEFKFEYTDQKVSAHFFKEAGDFKVLVSGAASFFSALIDSFIFLLNNDDQLKYINLREFGFYIKDDPKDELDLTKDILLVELIEAFNKFIESDLRVKKINFTASTLVEKIQMVQRTFDKHYTPHILKQNKSIEVVDIDENLIIIKLHGASNCELEKELEYMQNLLQDKLQCHDINVIPDC
jgi:Fe-S cluster biogenesis protein NfuA